MFHRMLVAGFVLLAGCTHMRTFSGYDEINMAAKDQLAEMNLLDGSVIECRNIHVTADTISWLDFDDCRQSIAAREVGEIVIVRSDRGAWEGFRVFMIGGSVLAAGAVILGVAALGSDDPSSGYAGMIAIGVALKSITIGVVGGALLGVPIGAAIGSSDVYVIQEETAGSKEKEPSLETYPVF